MAVSALRRTALATPARTPTIPPNWRYAVFSDSRGEQGNPPSYSNTTGVSWLRYNTGVGSWIESTTGLRLIPSRYPNYGISAGTAIQAAFAPRETSTNTVTTGLWMRAPVGNSPSSGSNNKGWDTFNADTDPGVVVMLLGTNDGGGGPSYTNITNYDAASRTAMTTILQGISPSRLIVLLSECPKGVIPAGTDATGVGAPMTAVQAAKFKAYSDFLAKFDFKSGDPLSQKNVVFVDIWSGFVDPATTTLLKNLPGVLQNDGLHFMPYGARQAAVQINAALSAAFGPLYDGLPPQVMIPLKDGLSAIATAQPYVNNNPRLTPGTNGTVAGTWGTPPTAATVPQGWTLNGFANASTWTGVSDKTVTDPADGSPAWKITLSGTVPANSATTIILNQTIWASNAAVNTAIAANLFSYVDKIRGLIRYKVDAGSVRLRNVLLNVAPVVSPATTAVIGSTGNAYGTSGIFLADLSGAKDAGGNWETFVSEILDMNEPGMATTNPVGGGGAGGPGNVTSMTSFQMSISLIFDNNPNASSASASATVTLSKIGHLRWFQPG